MSTEYNPLTSPTYLGDGVYAVFDGYGIELRANDNDNPTDTIYIEPQVFRNLQVFVEMIVSKLNTNITDVPE